MKKLFAFTYSLILSCSVFLAQESLSPLFVNSNITKNKKTSALIPKEGSIHNTFIYLFDTLSLPFLDDFSENHFPSFDASLSDPNVSDTTWFRIEVGGTPVNMGTNFMFDTTYTYQYDTVPGFGFDSIVLVNKIPNTSQIAEIFDIDNYPVTSSSETVWPDYNTYDSLWTGSSGQIIFIDFNDVDVFQDSSTVYFVKETSSDASTYWQDIEVFHNYTYANNIQTLGVVTFDGLDETGYPYDFNSNGTYGVADILTSKPLDLSGVTVADSVYISFLYEPEGLGEKPENTDSLVLEFWSPLYQEWYTVWSSSGFSSQNFEMELIKITDPIYFQNGFQFRFKNYGILYGSFDVWHLDYVYLNTLRSYDETHTEDWAFSNPSPSFIKNYTSMPWPHYEFSPETNMKTSVAGTTYSGATTNAFSDPCGMNLYFEDTQINNIPYTTVNTIPAESYFDMVYSIPSSFWFDTILADTCADFSVVQYIHTNSLNAFNIAVNDTLRHTQHFSNYYSYDDGTAEAAYGLSTAGGQLAYRFTLEPGLQDSLRAISIHFSPAQYDVSSELFYLQIWDDYQGEPGNVIYTTDDLISGQSYSPEYNLGTNGFYEYVLPEKVLVSGTYYIGWKQATSTRLNIGFDKNINTQDNIFYNLGSSWQNTSFEGSLMMHPVFISDKDYLLSLREAKPWNPEINIYPNPSNEWVTITSSDANISSFELYDLRGVLVLTDSFSGYQNTFSVNMLPNGMYILALKNEQNQQIQKKITVLR